MVGRIVVANDHFPRDSQVLVLRQREVDLFESLTNDPFFVERRNDDG